MRTEAGGGVGSLRVTFGLLSVRQSGRVERRFDAPRLRPVEFDCFNPCLVGLPWMDGITGGSVGGCVGCTEDVVGWCLIVAGLLNTLWRMLGRCDVICPCAAGA